MPLRHELVLFVVEVAEARRPAVDAIEHLFETHVAHVAVQEVPDPVQVLNDNRAVDSQLVIQKIDLVLICVRPQNRPPDVSWKHLRERENGYRQELSEST